jgi:hypothetical protein
MPEPVDLRTQLHRDAAAHLDKLAEDEEKRDPVKAKFWRDTANDVRRAINEA